MSPLNTLIKSWKIQNIGATKHFPIFKIFFNERNCVCDQNIREVAFSRKDEYASFLRNKNYRIYVKFITNDVC